MSNIVRIALAIFLIAAAICIAILGEAAMPVWLIGLGAKAGESPAEGAEIAAKFTIGGAAALAGMLLALGRPLVVRKRAGAALGRARAACAGQFAADIDRCATRSLDAIVTGGKCEGDPYGGAAPRASDWLAWAWRMSATRTSEAAQRRADVSWSAAAADAGQGRAMGAK